MHGSILTEGGWEWGVCVCTLWSSGINIQLMYIQSEYSHSTLDMFVMFYKL